MVESTPGGVILTLRVVPRAARPALVVDSGVLRARVSAAPVEGAANAALTELLASAFGIPKRAVEVVTGAHARNKRVRLKGVDAVRAQAVIASLAAEPPAAPPGAPAKPRG